MIVVWLVLSAIWTGFFLVFVKVPVPEAITMGLMCGALAAWVPKWFGLNKRE